MIIENTGLEGLQTDLKLLDDAMDKLGFIRWQWEYYRATYDLEIADPAGGTDYFLRINFRVIDGKLEAPDTILTAEHVYLGKAVFPHGVDYNASIPDSVLQLANNKLGQLHKALT